MPQPRFYGVIVPFITPFKEDLSLDLEAAKWLARFQVDRGAHGIFPNSTTGEFVHLKREEAVQLVRAVLEEVGGRAWVIPGITGNSTEECVSLGREFKDMGVHGVVVAPPYFFKHSKEALKKHFSTIAEKVELPVVVYNIPSLAGVNIPVDLYAELAEEHSNVVGAKVTYDSFTYMRRLVAEVKSVRSDFAVLTGLDDMLLPTLMMGGDGGITALANAAPWLHREVYEAWISGDHARALEVWRKILRLCRVYDVASSFPTAIKTLLKAMGAPVKPLPRPPLQPEPPEVEEKVRSVAEEVGVKI